MKKSLKIILVTLLAMIMILSTSCLAVSDNVTITPSKTDVKTGEEFTVSIGQECTEGAIGIEAELNYDKSVFELVGSPKMAEGWTNLGDENQIGAMSNDQQTSGEVMTLTFKAKKASTSTIELTNIKLYKSYENDGIITVANKSISMNVTGEPLEGNDNELKGIALDKTNLTLVMGVTTKMNLIAYPNPSDVTLPEIVWSSSDEKIAKLELTDTNGSISIVPVSAGNATITASTRDGKYSATCEVKVNANGNVSGDKTDGQQKSGDAGTAPVDDTTKSGVLPKTGAKTKIILISIAGLIVIGFVSYIGYRKYKEI